MHHNLSFNTARFFLKGGGEQISIGGNTLHLHLVQALWPGRYAAHIKSIYYANKLLAQAEEI